MIVNNLKNNFRILLLIDFTEEYGRALLRGITRYSKLYGPWSFCKMPSFVREKYGTKGILKFAKEWEAQGLIGQLYNDREIDEFIDSGICVIAEDFKERFEKIPNITSDYIRTEAMAAEYFLEKGYMHFAYYGFDEYVWSRERLEGYKLRLAKEKFQPHIFNYDSKNNYKLWYFKPSPLSEWLKKLPKPIALLACDDNQAIHIVDACNLAGIKIPDEIAVLGVDNDETVCNMANPPISSIYLNTENAGFEVAALMERMILNEKSSYKDIIVDSPTIVTRQSTDIFATKDKYVLDALHFIREHVFERIYVEDIAKHVASSRRALEKKFLTVTGKTIYQEILFRKMEKAAQLLLYTTNPVSEISLDCGFDSQKNFSRIFQKFYSSTPLQYRKKNSVL